MSEDSRELPVKDSVAAVWKDNDTIALYSPDQTIEGKKLLDVSTIPGQSIVDQYLNNEKNLHSYTDHLSGKHAMMTEGMTRDNIATLRDEATKQKEEWEQALTASGNNEALSILKGAADKDRQKQLSDRSANEY